jgi:hypothetical protein
MRYLSWRMTSCYYHTSKHSHSALAHCTLLEMLDVFSLHVAAEMSIASNNSSITFPLHSTPHLHTSSPAGIIALSSVLCFEGRYPVLIKYTCVSRQSRLTLFLLCGFTATCFGLYIRDHHQSDKALYNSLQSGIGTWRVDKSMRLK